MLLEGVDDSVAVLLAGWCVFLVLAVGRGIDRAREAFNTRPAPTAAPNRRSRPASTNAPARAEPQQPIPPQPTPHHQQTTQQDTPTPPPQQPQTHAHTRLPDSQTTEHALGARDQDSAPHGEGTEHRRESERETSSSHSSTQETSAQDGVQAETGTPDRENTPNFSTRYSFVPQQDGLSHNHIQAGELPPQPQAHTPQAPSTEGYPSTPLRQITFPGHVRVFSNWQILLFALVWSVFSGSAVVDALMRVFGGRGGQRARLVEVAVPFLFFGGGATVIYFLLMQSYNNYKMLVYGPSVQGRVTRVEADPTLIINGIPTTRITYTFQPRGAQVPVEGYFRTFDRGLIQRYRESQPVTIMYEPGHSSRNISPDSLGIRLTALHRD